MNIVFRRPHEPTTPFWLIIVGIVAGAVLLLGIIGFAVYKRRQSTRNQGESQRLLN
jgi:hypothetical protein